MRPKALTLHVDHLVQDHHHPVDPRRVQPEGGGRAPDLCHLLSAKAVTTIVAHSGMTTNPPTRWLVRPKGSLRLTARATGITRRAPDWQGSGAVQANSGRMGLMAHVQRFDHIGIPVVDLDSVTAFLV